MRQYLDMVRHVLIHGTWQENRTGVRTLAVFGYTYEVDLADGLPLLTTKRMSWDPMVAELFWYISGEEHVRNLRQKTKIWNAWADEDGRLETAYGRFWRRFPVPSTGLLDGERWGSRWVSAKQFGDRFAPTVDQLAYVVDSLREIKQNPAASCRRRLVVSAWHPGNAISSKLPPCHYTFCLAVMDGRLHCHLTQRSGDVALGVPFDLAEYAILTAMLAASADLLMGRFSHTIVDCHIYENHLAGLREQLTRAPRQLPSLTIGTVESDKWFFGLTPTDLHLHGYDPHPAIKFEVAV